MWSHVLISVAVLLASLIYHYHFGVPASIIDYPETHYDYIVGEFVFRFIVHWNHQPLSSPLSSSVSYPFEIRQHRFFNQIARIPRDGIDDAHSALALRK